MILSAKIRTKFDFSKYLAVISVSLRALPLPFWSRRRHWSLQRHTVRPVARIEQRISEAEKLGFSHIIIPKYNLSGLNRKKFNIELVPVRKVEEALRALFG